MTFLNTIQTFFSKNKINFLYILSFIAVFFVLGDNAWAGGADTGPAPKTDEQKTIESVNMFFKMMAVFMTLFTNLVGWFLSPDWTNGTIISGLHEMIKNLWLLVSNVVYFIFAMLFIWIALMNIIGQDGDNYKLKQAIPKFIVGVLIVPFSWFIVQFVISVSSVLTVAVLSIPYNDFKDVIEKTNNVEGEKFSINTCKFGYKIITKGSVSATEESQDSKFAIVCNPKEIGDNGQTSSGTIDKEDIPLSQLFANQQNTSLGLMYVYTYSVMKIDKADALFAGDMTKGVTDLSEIVFKFGFSLILFVAYTLLLIAMGFALFIRIIWLRMFAIFSPIFGLLYFFDKKEGVGEGALKNLSFMQLISVAMVPVYVAAALSFGFLFMRVADSGFAGGTKENSEGTKIENCFTLLGPLFTICWEGSLLDSNTKKDNQMFHGTIATLFGQFFALIFLWVGVMAALRSSDITKEVVQPIADFGASVGQIIQKGPANLPIIPVPDGKGGMTGMSARSLATIGQTGASSIEGASNKRANDLIEAHGLFGKGAKETMAAKEAVTYMKSVTGTNEEMYKKYDRALGEFKTIDSIKTNSTALEMLGEMAKKLDIKNVDLKTNDGIAKALAEIHNASISRSGYTSTMFGSELYGGNKDEAGVEPLLAGGTNGKSSTSTKGTTTATTNQTINITLGNNNQAVTFDANNNINNIDTVAQAFKSAGVNVSEVKSKFTDIGRAEPTNIQELINKITELNNSNNSSN